MLVDEHANANARHVEAVEEVVNAVFDCLVDLVRLPHFDDTLGHGGHDICVPVADLHQRVAEPVTGVFNIGDQINSWIIIS